MELNIMDFCRGWAAGASDADVPMSYEDVLDLWTSHKPSVKTILGMDTGEIVTPTALMACSGVAAWARATRAYIRAQVHALQAYQTLVPPPPGQA